MLCKKPFRVGVLEYGCGQCMPCRIDKRRLWATRLMLEMKKHEAVFFVTLTYKQECLPKEFTYKGVDYAACSVVPKHMQDFLKRYRWRCGDVRVRFYGVGEYGDVSGRPHYHLVLFGSDASTMIEAFGVTDSINRFRFNCEAWEFGHVDVRVMSWDLAWYIVGYVCKRFTKFGGEAAEKWLAGRYPEFARMSLRPGIGAAATEDIAEALNTKDGAHYVARNGDVPYVVKLQGKMLPLGRYLARKLRAMCGYPEEVPEGVLRRKAGEMAIELGSQALRDVRESRRVQHDRNAKARYALSTTKREL